MTVELLIGTLTQGLIYALVAFGVYITYTILDFPDLSVDGSFPLGAAVTAVLLTNGCDPWLSLVAATGVGVLAERMSVELARAAKLLRIGDGALVTCVPMHPKRLRKRGVNHAELLARGVAGEMELEFGDALMRTRNAPQQARLSDAERLRNLKGGFAVRPEWRARVSGAIILLIDDVFTTGSTARNCAEALLEAGAAKVYFAAYALGGGSKHGQNHQRQEPDGAAPAIPEGSEGAA